MPRPVSVRTSYREDSAHLIRFEGAILKDPDLPEGWRQQFAQMAHDLALRSLQADDLKNRTADEKKKLVEKRDKKRS
jgi:aspartate/tyrosine/aromatic aminotransferase